MKLLYTFTASGVKLAVNIDNIIAVHPVIRLDRGKVQVDQTQTEICTCKVADEDGSFYCNEPYDVIIKKLQSL